MNDASGEEGPDEFESIDEESVESDPTHEESIEPAGERADDPELEALRAQVEQKYDFENFGPSDMAEMTAEEWEAVFDHDTWITGHELLDRLERDLKRRIAERDVFAIVERVTEEGEPRLIAYSDEGYATVYPDGSVEGSGTVLRDVKPSIALCSIEDYEVKDPPEDYDLPSPEEVPEGTGELGNLMLQVIAFGQVVAGIAVIGVWGFTGLIPLDNVIAPVVGGIFLLIGIFLFTVVANARLSDRFRAEQYRNRLRALRIEDADRPEMFPPETSTSREDE